MDLPAITGMDGYFKELASILNDRKSKEEFYEAIVNAAFHDRFRTTTLGLGFLAFLLVNNKTNMIDRIAISDTYTAQGAISITIKPFHDIKIPLNDRENIIAKAIRTGRYQQTSDWRYLLSPDLSPEQARMNQAGAGIACSFVYPLTNTPAPGAIIFHYYTLMLEVGAPHRDFMFRYTKLVSSALSHHSKK